MIIIIIILVIIIVPVLEFIALCNYVNRKDKIKVTKNE